MVQGVTDGDCRSQDPSLTSDAQVLSLGWGGFLGAADSFPPLASLDGPLRTRRYQRAVPAIPCCHLCGCAPAQETHRRRTLRCRLHAARSLVPLSDLCIRRLQFLRRRLCESPTHDRYSRSHPLLDPGSTHDLDHGVDGRATRGVSRCIVHAVLPSQPTGARALDDPAGCAGVVWGSTTLAAGILMSGAVE